mmetsp:Transcript_5914/g.19717  ORF Transcript_5914/g.19717 Transcript_5914/m.19717 type:complete len:464 (+) Transcript_5914:896-2287(+)
MGRQGDVLRGARRQGQHPGCGRGDAHAAGRPRRQGVRQVPPLPRQRRPQLGGARSAGDGGLCPAADSDEHRARREAHQAQRRDLWQRRGRQPPLLADYPRAPNPRPAPRGVVPAGCRQPQRCDARRRPLVPVDDQGLRRHLRGGRQAGLVAACPRVLPVDQRQQVDAAGRRARLLRGSVERAAALRGANEVFPVHRARGREGVARARLPEGPAGGRVAVLHWDPLPRRQLRRRSDQERAAARFVGGQPRAEPLPQVGLEGGEAARPRLGPLVASLIPRLWLARLRAWGRQLAPGGRQHAAAAAARRGAEEEGGDGAPRKGDVRLAARVPHQCRRGRHLRGRGHRPHPPRRRRRAGHLQGDDEPREDQRQELCGAVSRRGEPRGQGPRPEEAPARQDRRQKAGGVRRGVRLPVRRLVQHRLRAARLRRDRGLPPGDKRLCALLAVDARPRDRAARVASPHEPSQ